MQELIERIRKDGRIKPGNVLKVDSFLNHQIDPKLAHAMAQEIKRLYADETVNKVLTIEASGIGLAVLTGYLFECPVVFAKKASPAMCQTTFTRQRYTHIPTARITPSSCQSRTSTPRTGCSSSMIFSQTARP